VSDFQARKKLYRAVERELNAKVLAFVTSDRRGMETRIATDCIELFVDLLDAIGPTERLAVLLHTDGGDSAAAWRLVNLWRMFGDEVDVLIPSKALSAGTLISLGADKIIMSKQAALGPIDPSLNHPLNPPVLGGNPGARVPVSVEAVRGYLQEAQEGLGIKDQEQLTKVFLDLANKIHPLVLGQIFRSRSQIRFLAKKLIKNQVSDAKKTEKIIDFLCADSGSHDYTINRREAEELGLKIAKPSQDFYKVLRRIKESYTAELRMLEPYSAEIVLGTNNQTNYSIPRGLVESANGSYAYISEGTLTRGQAVINGIPQDTVTDNRTFEGWRKVA
jgi:hypothetical protein